MARKEGGAKGAKPAKGPKPKNVTIAPPDAVEKARPHVLRLLHAGGLTDHVDELADIVLKAAAHQTTLNDACRDADDTSSRRTLSEAFSGLVLDAIEHTVNDELWRQLERRFPPRPILGIDWTLIPYHGHPHEDPDELKRSQAKDGTTWFHAYATVYVCWRNRRYTFLVRFVRGSQTPTESLDSLMDDVERRGVQPRLVLADKAFCTVAALQSLKARRVPFILPLPLKGKRAKALQKGKGAYETTYELRGETVRVAVVVKRNADKYHGKKRGRNAYFPYVVHGLRAPPRRVDALYRLRGGIESSYRLMNQARARTSSRNPAVRLFYVAVSFLLQNAWVTLAWSVSAPKRGHQGRWRPKGFFPFVQFLRMVVAWFDDEHGVELVIVGLGPWRRRS